MSSQSSTSAKRNFSPNHIKQWRASDQTLRQYCQQHQLTYHQLVYWKQVFTIGSIQKQRPSSGNGFVSVQLKQPSN